MNINLRKIFIPISNYHRVFQEHLKTICACKNYHHLNNSSADKPAIKHIICRPISVSSNLYAVYSPLANIYRSKSTKHTYDDEEDFSEGDKSLSRDSKVTTFRTTSMRADLILKSALSISRNKIEKIFYESKIRINGKKILKKGVSVHIGDEVDIIKTVSERNPDHLYVARVELLKVVAAEDHISVTARRFKNLLIENYKEDPYKAGTNDSAT